MAGPCPTGQERTKSRGKAKALADPSWTKGQVDTWQARFADAAKVDTRPETRRTHPKTWRTHGGQETRPKWTQGGHTWQTHGGQGLDAQPKRTQGGHMADAIRSNGGQCLEVRADTRRTYGGVKADKLRGRGQGISRPAVFGRFVILFCTFARGQESV